MGQQAKETELMYYQWLRKMSCMWGVFIVFTAVSSFANPNITRELFDEHARVQEQKQRSEVLLKDLKNLSSKLQPIGSILPGLDVCKQVNGRVLNDLTKCLYKLVSIDEFLKEPSQSIFLIKSQSAYLTNPSINSQVERIAMLSSENSESIKNSADKIRQMQIYHLSADLSQQYSSLSRFVSLPSLSVAQCGQIQSEFIRITNGLPNIFMEHRKLGDPLMFRRALSFTEKVIELTKLAEQKCNMVRVERSTAMLVQLSKMEVPTQSLFAVGCSRVRQNPSIPPDMVEACRKNIINPYTEGTLHFLLRGEHVF